MSPGQAFKTLQALAVFFIGKYLLQIFKNVGGNRETFGLFVNSELFC
jgi:hypothetical protein